MFRIIGLLVLTALICAGCGQRNVSDKNREVPRAESANQNVAVIDDQPAAKDDNGFQWPIGRAAERVTKKHYSTFVTPKNSPVNPEVFSGYHTGTDFEIFSEEADMDVSITAVCDGTLISKRTVTGYGGVVIQSCVLENNAVTILYGHLKLSSVSKKTGDEIQVGEVLGVLGKGYSSETSGERKHLHLSIHKGSSIELAGYVQNKKDLQNWLDPEVIIGHE
jgi:murein DD-endopeptidase MepM/ murein hydrolase activator NlpD